MCGRIALVKPKEGELKKRFKLKRVPKSLKPRYNISPSQEIPVVLNSSPDELSMVKWGLVPSWAKEVNTKYSMINARAETITEKPAYRGPIRHKRCLIIADSFYEWKRTGSSKKPFRIMMKDEGLFAIAGVWDCWKKNGEELVTCSIITTSPNKLMDPIHDRMPVILPQELEKKWLSEIPLEDVQTMLKPYDAKPMDAYEISTLVNSPANNTPEVLNRL